MNATPFISEITVTRRARFGGFEACLSGQLIFVLATAWRGSQPRLVLSQGQDGYSDWRKLLDKAPEINETHKFVGDPEASHSVVDQWLTHEPHELLNSL